MDKKALAGLVWETIVSAYHQGGRTKVVLPAQEVAEALLSVLANVVSQIPSPAERARILSDMAPRTARMVDTVRQRSNLHLPSRPNLVI